MIFQISARRFCYCQGPKRTTQKSNNSIKESITSIELKSDYPGYYQCFLAINGQLFVSEVAQFRIGGWNFYPSAIVLQSQPEVFMCGAAILGDSSGDVPSVEWSFSNKHFPSLRNTNPTMVGRANMKNSGVAIQDSNFKKTIECNGFYKDSSGNVDLPRKQFNVKLLEIFGTHEGTEGYGVMGQSVTLSCAVTTNDAELGRSLELMSGPTKPIENSVVEERHYGSNDINFNEELKADSSIFLDLRDVDIESSIVIEFYIDDSRKFRIEFTADELVYVNDQLHTELAMFPIASSMKIKILFISNKKFGIVLNDAPVELITQSSNSEKWNKFSILNGQLAEFLILKKLPVFQTSFNKKSKNGIYTFTHVAKMKAISSENVGYYLCNVEKFYDQKHFYAFSEPFHLKLAIFTSPPLEEVVSLAKSGSYFEMAGTAIYFERTNDPLVSLFKGSNKTEIISQYSTLLPNIKNKTLDITYLIPWTLPYVRTTNYTWQLNYTKILYPGVVEFTSTVYESFIEVESDIILTLAGTTTTITCLGYGAQFSNKFGQLLIDGEEQSLQQWAPKLPSYAADKKLTTFKFTGTATGADDAVYGCKAQTQDDIELKSVNQATLFIVTYKLEPSAFDGIVDKPTSLYITINVPDDDTELNVSWIDERGAEQEEDSQEIKDGVYTSYFSGQMDLTKSYFARVVIGDGEMDSIIQRPLVREGSLEYTKVVAVELQPVYISGTIKATTKPADIMWFRDGEKVVDPNWTIGRTSETTFAARLYFLYDRNLMDSEDIVGEYTLRALWNDGDQVDSINSTVMTSSGFIQDLPHNLFAPLTFPLELKIEIEYEKDFVVDITWYEYWTMEYEIDEQFVKTKKGVSKLKTESISNIYNGVQFYAAVNISIASTGQEFIVWTNYAEVVIQKTVLSYKGVQDQMAFVVEGTQVQV